MNQSLTYEFGQVIPIVEQADLFVSLCTIQARTGAVSVTGQPDLTDWVNIVGLVNIPCRKAIQRPYNPNQQATVRTPQQFDTQTQFHVLLDGYFPQIIQANQAVVDGVPYEIMAVESDSENSVMTRLALRVWTQ
jgi:hypothetical protein